MLDSIFSIDTLWYLLLLLYVPACVLLIGIVLLQKGKGMGFAGAFGGGGTEAVFGPRAVRSLPQKITYTMAGLFMFLAMIMSMISGRVGRGDAPAPVSEMESNDVTKVVNEVLDGAAPAPAADANATTTVVTPVAPADGAAAPAAAAPAEAAPAATPVTEATPADAPAADAPAAAAPAEAAPAAEAPAAETPVTEAPAAEAPAPQ